MPIEIILIINNPIVKPQTDRLSTERYPVNFRLIPSASAGLYQVLVVFFRQMHHAILTG